MYGGKIILKGTIEPIYHRYIWVYLIVYDRVQILLFMKEHLKIASIGWFQGVSDSLGDKWH